MKASPPSARERTCPGSHWAPILSQNCDRVSPGWSVGSDPPGHAPLVLPRCTPPTPLRAPRRRRPSARPAAPSRPCESDRAPRGCTEGSLPRVVPGLPLGADGDEAPLRGRAAPRVGGEERLAVVESPLRRGQGVRPGVLLDSVEAPAKRAILPRSSTTSRPPQGSRRPWPCQGQAVRGEAPARGNDVSPCPSALRGRIVSPKMHRRFRSGIAFADPIVESTHPSASEPNLAGAT